MFDEWLEESDYIDEDKDEAREQFEGDVIDQVRFCGKDEAYRNMIDFEFHGDTPFVDWWEVDTDQYSFRFIWCCYALAWGVAKYDAATSCAQHPKEQDAQTTEPAIVFYPAGSLGEAVEEGGASCQ